MPWNPRIPTEDELLARPPLSRAWITARIAAGLSQEEACRRLRITVAWLSMIENGKGTPSPALTRRAVAVYDAEHLG